MKVTEFGMTIDCKPHCQKAWSFIVIKEFGREMECKQLHNENVLSSIVVRELLNSTKDKFWQFAKALFPIVVTVLAIEIVVKSLSIVNAPFAMCFIPSWI